MKLFLAVSLPQTFRKYLQEAYNPIMRDYPQFNWVPQQNYHITIAYLGERGEDKMELIHEAIERSIFDIPPTRMFTLETGMFVKNGIKLRLAYVRNKELGKIRERVIDYFSVSKENLARQTYVPHTTLAQYKLPSKQQYFHLRKKLANLNIEGEFPVNQIHLYQSITKPTNPEYEILHTFELVE